MTKSYHLTQEQVRDIGERLRNEGELTTTNLVNAVLDQVLGEPVAEAFIDNFGDLKIYPIGIASKSLIVARGDSKLYALKEQT